MAPLDQLNTADCVTFFQGQGQAVSEATDEALAMLAKDRAGRGDTIGRLMPRLIGLLAIVKRTDE